MTDTGTRAGPLAKRLLRNPRTKHWMRLLYTLQSLWTLKRASLQGVNYKDFFQAGKSVEGIVQIQPVKDIVADFARAADTVITISR